MNENVISLDKVRQEEKEREIREFYEFCKANAPEFLLIEEVNPNPVELLIIHSSTK